LTRPQTKFSRGQKAGRRPVKFELRNDRTGVGPDPVDFLGAEVTVVPTPTATPAARIVFREGFVVSGIRPHQKPAIATLEGDAIVSRAR
jgi:hypothetical protein